MSWCSPIAALLLVALSAAAQAQAPATPPAAGAEDRRELRSLPPQEQRALRHEQTREDDVRRLENERYGAADAARQRSRQKDEVDQLYQQIIKQSQELSAAPR